MELPEIHLLQAAMMLAELRNYSRAAQKLGIHQPTLTKRILEVEQIMGFPLFVRTTQFVEPTDACRQFVEEAKPSVFHAERSIQVARAAEKGARTVVHVGKRNTPIHTSSRSSTLLSCISIRTWSLAKRACT